MKNNQMSNQIKRQKTVNQARQDEIHLLDMECKKKDDEAINLKRELERIQGDISQKRIQRDQQELDNQSLQFQNSKKEQNISVIKNDIGSLNRKLDDFNIQERVKQGTLSTKETELQRKKDALHSSQTELKRLEVDLAEFEGQQYHLEKQKRELDISNREVEKVFYSENKRQEDLEKQIKDIKIEVDQLELRKAHLVGQNEKLSNELNEYIERNELLRNELRAVGHLADQYESNNRTLLDEMQMQATQNEEIQSHLQRKEKIEDMRKNMEAELQR